MVVRRRQHDADSGVELEYIASRRFTTVHDGVVRCFKEVYDDVVVRRSRGVDYWR